MSTHKRFALYYTAPGSELAQRGATWLGWDIAQGRAAETAVGPAEVVATPRKYGFHGTLKPPFRLAAGMSVDALFEAARDMASNIPAFEVPALRVSQLGSFLALTPAPSEPLSKLAAACVTSIDDFRAPPTEAELAKRRSRGLSERQEALLAQWGYPYVMEEFRFHLTLTGRIEKSDREEVLALAEAHFAPCLTAPHRFEAVTLCGELEDGQFEELEVLPLGT